MIKVKIAESISVNPKMFWSHIRKKLKTKPGVALLLENTTDKKSIMFDDIKKQIYYKDSLQASSIINHPVNYRHLVKKTNTSITSVDLTTSILKC